MSSRRAFLNRLALAVPAAGLSQAASAASAGCAVNERVTLDGLWDFRLDTETKWKTVTVPHTWQTAAESAGFYGVGWCERDIDSTRRCGMSDSGKGDAEKARYWQRTIGEAVQSGISIRQFCRQRRLKESQFYW